MSLEEKRDALRTVIDAASIHHSKLTDGLTDRSLMAGFKQARVEYLNKLRGAISEVSRLKLDEELKVQERVSELSLEDAVDLYFALETHIKNLRGIR